MKRLMLTSLAVFFAHMLMAQVANFVVFSPEGQPFYLYLDGKLQNSSPGQNIKIRYVPEGNYTVKAVLLKDGKTATSTVMIPAKKELSYIVENDKTRGFIFSHYSEVPISHTNTVTSTQKMVEYSSTGRTKKNGEIGSGNVATAVDPNGNSSNGVYTGGDLTNKREGQIKMVTYVAPDGTTRKVTQEEAKRLMAEANKTTVSTTTKEPETGTTEVRAYKEEVHADGSVSIIEEVTTITKVIVNRNGQDVLKTKKQTLQYPTKFKCLPMAKDLHQVLEMKITNAPNNERLAIAKAGVKDQCLTSHQVKIIGNLIAEGQERNDFAIFAKDFCADPKNYPYKVDDPVIVAKVDDPKTLNNDNNNENTNTNNTVSEPKKIEPVEPEKELTAKEMKIKMKAELKLKKLKEKEAKKAAKLAVKEAKKKAKEAAKAAKLAEKKVEK